jgi:hypothetical protein
VAGIEGRLSLPPDVDNNADLDDRLDAGAVRPEHLEAQFVQARLGLLADAGELVSGRNVALDDASGPLQTFRYSASCRSRSPLKTALMINHIFLRSVSRASPSSAVLPPIGLSRWRSPASQRKEQRISSSGASVAWPAEVRRVVQPALDQNLTTRSN